MKKFDIYQVDAFASSLFKGNPAAVVPLAEWLPEELMQQLAMENNLSETVFFVPVNGGINASADSLKKNANVSTQATEYDIRWFTPGAEINLCGHATLAAAFVLFNYLNHPSDKIIFHSKSGPLIITNGELITMDFPRWKPLLVESQPANLGQVLGATEVISISQYRDLLIELKDEAAVQNCQPDFTAMKKYGFDKIIITAAGSDVDFVSRFFAPGVGVDEDPVTGSAHSQLIPFWAERLGKNQLTAKQLSARGGYLVCENQAERVFMGGHGFLFMKGEIYLPEILLTSGDL